MKKMMGLLASLLVVFSLTGCGEKKLTCNLIENEDEYVMSQDLKLTFDNAGNGVTKGSTSMKFTVNEEYLEYFEDFKDYIVDNFEDAKGSGISVGIKAKDATITIKVNYDVSKLTEDQLDELYYLGIYADTTYDETVSELKDMGYTCK